MNCFPCFSSQKSKMESNSKNDHEHSFHPEPHPQPTEHVTEAPTVTPANYETGSSINAFNFREMLSATKNFRQEFLLGEGSHGKVYKGSLQGKEVAVKQLDKNAMEGNNEFFVEVGNLSLLQHPNMVSLIGYCNDGDQRLLVYEFMSGGSLEYHLHGGGKPLDWVTRMKIAHGAAEGLQYLHEKAKPAVLYRDLQSSKILLDVEFNPKLANVGLDTKIHMQMDNLGYTAPELTNSGSISKMTDVYSFGVILLELITGRKPLDQDNQTLVDWAQPIFKEPKHFPDMADPLLKKKFPERGLNQAVAIAAMCVQEEAAARPLISDLASVLGFLSIAKEENNIPPTLPSTISSKLHCISDKLQFMDGNDQSGKRQAQLNAPIPEGDEEGESDDEDDEGSTSGGSDEETDQPNKGEGDGDGDGDGDEDHGDGDEDHGDGDEDHGDGDEEHGDGDGNGDGDEDHGDGDGDGHEDHGDGDGDGDGNGSRSLSHKSSGRSMFSTNNDSGRETNSMSRKESKKSESSSSFGNEDDDEDDDGNKLAPSSSGDLSDAADAAAATPDASTARRNKKSKKKLVDESDNNSLGKKKKSSEKIKSRKSTKKKKVKDETSKSSTKKSHGESNSPGSVKKNRHKSKKRSDKDDDLAGESQHEN